MLPLLSQQKQKPIDASYGSREFVFFFFGNWYEFTLIVYSQNVVEITKTNKIIFQPTQ